MLYLKKYNFIMANSAYFNKFLLDNNKSNNQNNNIDKKNNSIDYFKLLNKLYMISGGIIAAFLVTKEYSNVDFMTMGTAGFIGYLCPDLSFIVGGGYLLKLKYNDYTKPLNKAADLLTSTIQAN
jgi:hypothetical protein